MKTKSDGSLRDIKMILVSARSRLLDEIRAVESAIEYAQEQNMMTFQPPNYAARSASNRKENKS